MDSENQTELKKDENMDTQPDETVTESIEEISSTNTEQEIQPEHAVPVVQQLVLLGAILLLLLGGTFTPKIIAFFQNTSDTVPAAPIYSDTPSQSLNTTKESSQIKPFSEISITGKSAYVWDMQAQRALYKKDAGQQLPLASVTKLMTALVAHELLSEDSSITIHNQAILQDGDSGLLRNETFKRATLSDLVLMSSSNDGAYALAVAAGGLLQKANPADAFVHAMNIRAEELSLHDTYFKNPTGLDISESIGGAYGTAKDIAFLMEYIVVNQPNILEATQDNIKRLYSKDGIYHDAINTNYHIDEIPGLIGSKTGYTDLAGGNLVIAFDAGLNRPMVISVLGSTRQERFTDVLKLVKEVQNYVAQQ